jgi:hypothetical protein
MVREAGFVPLHHRPDLLSMRHYCMRDNREVLSGPSALWGQRPVGLARHETGAEPGPKGDRRSQRAPRLSHTVGTPWAARWDRRFACQPGDPGDYLCSFPEANRLAGESACPTCPAGPSAARWHRPAYRAPRLSPRRSTHRSGRFLYSFSGRLPATLQLGVFA